MKKKKIVRVPVAGKRLGTGAYKSCYAIGKTRAALVACYCDYRFLLRDFNLLKDLEALGVPVVKAKIGIIKLEGKRRRAIILPRYDFGGLRAATLPHSRLNRTHKKQLVTIYNAIKEKGLYMPDMQFLLRHGKKSEIVLADPNGCETADCYTSPISNYNLKELGEAMKTMGIAFEP